MSKAASMCLFGLGPDCCSLATCDSSDLTLLFTRRVVRTLTKRPELLSLLTVTTSPCLQQMRVCTECCSSYQILFKLKLLHISQSFTFSYQIIASVSVSLNSYS